MRVLVLGGTGSIGGPIVRELVRRGHEVVALARSDASATRIAGLGALPMPGDISAPAQWLSALPALDGVIHVAATWGDEEQITDQRLLDALLPALSAAPRTIRFIYTGGCWLFGSAAGEVTNEQASFNPLPAFAWTVPHLRRVLDTPGIRPIVIHPAMVYEPCGGVFAQFRLDAIHRHAVRVVGSESVHWPLVHSADLAMLYCLALEGSPAGEAYIGAAIEGMPVGRIARAFTRRFQTRRADPEIISEDEIAAEIGEWARGYTLDQRQSGAKARQRLGWKPQHLDPESEIARID